MCLLSMLVLGVFAVGMAVLWQTGRYTMPAVLTLFAGLFVLTVLAAYYLAGRIVTPIAQMQPEAPLHQVPYQELRPIVQYVQEQNVQIHAHIAALETRQREFAALTEHMNEGLLILNDQGYILSMNQRAMHILGLLDKAPHDKLHILMANCNQELQKLVDDGLNGRSHNLLLELDGRVYEVVCNAIQQSGMTQGLVLFLLDVTEKQQQEKLRREFTANVSHELRTPLTAISGYAEIMMHGLVPAENIAPFAEKIYQEANRMITLIADIIQLSQLDEASEAFRWEVVDVAKLAEEAAGRLQSKAEQHGITLSVYTEPAAVVGVAQVIQEILYNLCDNAIKYNKPKGMVKVSVIQSGGNVVIKVADNGIGIAPEDLPRIFERFYRADKSHSRLIGGTGLGLSIVKHGVQLHAGEVQLESKPDVGTVITVRLPMEQQENR